MKYLLLVLLLVACDTRPSIERSYSGEICINGTKYLVYKTYGGYTAPTPKYVRAKLEVCK